MTTNVLLQYVPVCSVVTYSDLISFATFVVNLIALVISCIGLVIKLCELCERHKGNRSAGNVDRSAKRDRRRWSRKETK